MIQSAPLTLREYNLLLRNSIASHPELQYRWVTAELSDFAVRGHCYMELIEKDECGNTVAKMRANIWSNRFYALAAKFRQATGRDLQGGLKVMLQGTASFHEQYGISFNVVDIDPSYTLGDLERLRREILMRLNAEGVLNRNKEQAMPPVPQRIAVISAPGAAGYGDFLNQLLGNAYGVVFYPVLFEAVMQGDRTAATVCAALERIEMSIDAWDCVVIIRGGGATTDLNGFDNLELARAVATFPIPVIVGIGHERDRTVLDEIAHTRVKTPTAAAEWLLKRALDTWERLESLMRTVATTATALVAGNKQQLSQMETLMHSAAQGGLARASARLSAIASLLPSLADKRIALANSALDFTAQQLRAAADSRLLQENQRLDRLKQLSEVLSPTHTLRRGYSLTLHNGSVVKNAADLPPGTTFTTRFADGDVTATAN